MAVDQEDDHDIKGISPPPASATFHLSPSHLTFTGRPHRHSRDREFNELHGSKRCSFRSK